MWGNLDAESLSHRLIESQSHRVMLQRRSGTSKRLPGQCGQYLKAHHIKRDGYRPISAGRCRRRTLTAVSLTASKAIKLSEPSNMFRMDLVGGIGKCLQVDVVGRCDDQHDFKLASFKTMMPQPKVHVARLEQALKTKLFDIMRDSTNLLVLKQLS